MNVNVNVWHVIKIKIGTITHGNVNVKDNVNVKKISLDFSDSIFENT